MTPTLSIIIPATRPSVHRAVASIQSSIRNQKSAISAELIVIADGPGVPGLEQIPARVFEFSAAHKDWGAAARNVGMAAARGQWIAFLDDDDIWLPSAAEALCSRFSPSRSSEGSSPLLPVLFRMERTTADPARVLWRDKAVRLGNVSTQMMMVPTKVHQLPRWRPVYTGDFFFIQECEKLFGGVEWKEGVVARWNAEEGTSY